MAPAPLTATAVPLRITMKGTKPPIWREVLVPTSMTMQTLHQTIQAAMGWWDTHLFEFDTGDDRIGEPDPDFDEADVTLARNVKLATLLRRGVRRFTYLYDFGDHWEHRIEVKREIPLLPGEEVPILLGGARRCPPEDVGSLSGFEDFLEAMADQAHPEHDDMTTCYGGAFDPDDIDEARINARLAAIASRRRRRPVARRD
jgi:Plasmid pRiA4b ORF-3-like protein